MELAKLPPGTTAKTFRFAGIYLAVELAVFVVIHLLFHIPAAALVIAFLYCGVPALMQIPVLGLRWLDARGVSAKVLALCWFWLVLGLSCGLKFVIIQAAFACHMLSRTDAVGVFVAMAAIAAVIDFFVIYLKVETDTAARRSGRAVP